MLLVNKGVEKSTPFFLTTDFRIPPVSSIRKLGLQRMTPAKLIFLHARPEMVGIRMTLANLSFFLSGFRNQVDSYDENVDNFIFFIMVYVVYLYSLNQTIFFL